MSATVIYTKVSVMETANGNSSDFDVGNYTELALDVNCDGKQGTSPTLQIIVERKGADNNYFPIYTSSATSVSSAAPSTPVQFIKSFGAGCEDNDVFGNKVRVRWVIGGSATPGAQFTISIISK